ncbi:hypothetical protein JHK82_044503 [Glycine max]|nr:hypothetical protein JHK82_044503 [Glycine max]
MLTNLNFNSSRFRLARRVRTNVLSSCKSAGQTGPGDETAIDLRFSPNKHKIAAFSGDETAPFFGFLGATATLHGRGSSPACPVSDSHRTPMRVRLRCDAVSVAGAVTGRG